MKLRFNEKQICITSPLFSQSSFTVEQRQIVPNSRGGPVLQTLVTKLAVHSADSFAFVSQVFVCAPVAKFVKLFVLYVLWHCTCNFSVMLDLRLVPSMLASLVTDAGSGQIYAEH